MQSGRASEAGTLEKPCIESEKLAVAMKWAKIGFLTGGMIPVGIALYMFGQITGYQAAHPLGPNEALCGMPMLGALMMLVVVSPIGGAMGALVGKLCCMLVNRPAKATRWPLAITGKSGSSTQPNSYPDA